MQLTPCRTQARNFHRPHVADLGRALRRGASTPKQSVDEFAHVRSAGGMHELHLDGHAHGEHVDSSTLKLRVELRPAIQYSAELAKQYPYEVPSNTAPGVCVCVCQRYQHVTSNPDSDPVCQRYSRIMEEPSAGPLDWRGSTACVCGGGCISVCRVFRVPCCSYSPKP